MSWRTAVRRTAIVIFMGSMCGLLREPFCDGGPCELGTTASAASREGRATMAVKMAEAVASIGQHTNMMPRERGITLPLVSRDGNGLVVRRLIYMKRPIPQAGTVIGPPIYVASYDLTRGAFVSVEKLELDSGGLPPPPWKFDPPRFERPEEIVPEFQRIWSLYDILVSAFEAGGFAPGPGVGSAARELLGYVDRHREAPLAGFYDRFGGEFFAFVRRVAK